MNTTDTTLPPNTIREKTQAPFHFTPRELGELGKKLSSTRKDAAQLDAELASIKAS